jgi:hypothetical protein
VDGLRWTRDDRLAPIGALVLKHLHLALAVAAALPAAIPSAAESDAPAARSQVLPDLTEALDLLGGQSRRKAFDDP